MTYPPLYKRSQQDRLAKAIHLAGSRYTPRLNVAVSIATIFDGLGRTRRFYETLKKPAVDLLKHLRSVNDAAVTKVAPRQYEAARNQCLRVAKLLNAIPISGVRRIDYRRLALASTRAQKAIQKCVDKLRKFEEQEAAAKRLQEPAAAPSSATSRPADEPFRNDKYYLYRVTDTLGSLNGFMESKTALAANTPRILLNGIAGSGKTHFLCDSASERMAEGLPTYIFLGEEISDRDPLKSVRSHLGAPGREADFLRTLDRYAASKRTRAILIVDAINESKVRGVRWARLAALGRYKHIGVVLSVRSGFERAELSEDVMKKCVRVEHQGFATHEWEAVTKFFAIYGLPLPEVPLLFPEFRIPLFLKIFCEAFAGSSKPVKGHYGFTHIFEQYVKRQGEGVLDRLGETSNAGESRKRVWNGVIKEMALSMGNNGRDTISETEARSIVAKEFPSRPTDALDALEKLFLITKTPKYEKLKPAGFEYRFPYQKFSDHLIVRNLLNEHLEQHKAAPERAFRRGSKLHTIIKGAWFNRGLIEALSIQVPQRLRGRELIHVAPRQFRREQIAKETFLESLIWRDLSLEKGRAKFIRQRWVLDYLNKHILPYRGGDEQMFETILTVATVPNHPLNALLLHSHLRSFDLAKRDAMWLPYLNTRFDVESAVDRLIVWAWDGQGITAISDDALRLAGIALAWFFASSNRFLRDRATKALTSVLRGRIRPLIGILSAFEGVNDPYVSERLYAVAYGVALDPTISADDAARLARYVYDKIFKKRRPPVHLLLRDYARGVVEAGVMRNEQLRRRINLRHVRPPYRSSFPTKIPSVKYLRSRYHPEKPKRPKERGGKYDYDAIWSSLMYDNGGVIADFGNYVVNSTVRHWCNIRLPKDGKRPATAKENAEAFQAHLNRFQRRRWRELESERQALSIRRVFIDMKFRAGQNADIPKFTREEIEAAAKGHAEAEAAFVKSLPPEVQRLYRSGVLLYRERSSGANDLDLGAIQRIIFARIIKLGWRPELFAAYDSSVRNPARESHKVERIGKKYQWIAFHETLARIADNFCFKEDFGDAIKRYVGPWQAWERDIDPTCLLHGTPKDDRTARAWWAPAPYRRWQPNIGHTRWAHMTSDLPEQRRLMQVRRKGVWLTLDGFVRWEQPTLPGEERFAFDKIRRDVWYIVRSYLVRQADAKKTFAWAKKQDFMGRWMPDPVDMHNVFMREFPDGLAYRYDYDRKNRPRWTAAIDRKDRRIRFPLLSTTEAYVWEGSGFDCSVDGGVRILFPAHEIVKGLRLKQGVAAGTFVDQLGDTVAMDPSVQQAGPSMLLVKKEPFLRYLRRNRFEMLWIVIGEKLLLGEDGGNFLGRLEMGGAFKMSAAGKLEGKTYSKRLPPRIRQR
jgi:hypothetical protein